MIRLLVIEAPTNTRPTRKAGAYCIICAVKVLSQYIQRHRALNSKEPQNYFIDVAHAQRDEQKKESLLYGGGGITGASSRSEAIAIIGPIWLHDISQGYAD